MRQLDSTTVARTERPVRILQFGGGNFLRAFVDWMVEQANTAGVTDHGIAIAHVTPQPDRAIELLREQDGLFHVYLEGIADGEPVREATLVTAVQEVVEAHTDFARFRELYLGEDLQVLVSNTTEAGIAWLPGDDLTATPPLSFPAKVTALLLDRYRHFDGDPERGLAIVCCELIEDNGSTLREYVLRHAAANGLDAGFVQWVREHCRFYDTLVDRIVPGFPHADIAEIQAELGYRDQLVVKAEYYYVWAIAGDPALREVLPLERAGLHVELMDDIRPYRAKKVRVLNGAHTALTPVGLLLGHATVLEAFADPDTQAYVRRLVTDEVLPTIDEDPRALIRFADGILERFSNPYLEHRLADIALNSLSKWQTRNLPVVLDSWRAGRPALRTVLSLAAWLLLYSGRSGVAFDPVDDPAAVALVRDTWREHDLPGWVAGVLDGCITAGTSATPAEVARLTEEVAAAVATLRADGVAQVLRERMAPVG